MTVPACLQPAPASQRMVASRASASALVARFSEKAEAELVVIFEFLLNTKELTLEEYTALCNMVVEMDDAARKAATV